MPPKQLTAYIKSMYDPARDHVRSAMRHGGHGARHQSPASHPATPAIQSFVSSMVPVWSNTRLNSIHLAAVMTRLAYLVHDGHLEGHAGSVPGVTQMLAHVEACFSQLPPSTDHQSLTNLLWAAAKLGHTPSPAFVSGVWLCVLVVHPPLQCLNNTCLNNTCDVLSMHAFIFIYACTTCTCAV